MSVDISHPETMRSVSTANEKFSRSLVRELVKEKTGDENLLVSPYR